MQIYEYKGYTIYPAPHFVACSKEWKIELAIKFDNEIKKFRDDQFFSTEGEAIFHSIKLGKHLIDQNIVLFDCAI